MACSRRLNAGTSDDSRTIRLPPVTIVASNVQHRPIVIDQVDAIALATLPVALARMICWP